MASNADGIDNGTDAVHTVEPSFSSLPLREGDPPYSAWGLWGTDDHIGTLNRLTPAVVRGAASEISEGTRFSLNWCLSKPTTPGFLRYKDAFEHTIVGEYVLDDKLVFNTQKSTQWDGLRHFAYQQQQLFYNGTTREQIVAEGSGGSEAALGMHWWHKAGGVAGRGFLIDYWAYAEAHGKTYDPMRPGSVSFDDLMACLGWQQQQQTDILLQPRPGDILLLRLGFSARYAHLDRDQERAVGEAWPPASYGVHQDRRLLQWLWDSKFAAVGGDSPGWEAFPVDERAGFFYHEVLLAGWGCPIAELLWLEDVASWCCEHSRWTFFLSSCPLNVFGGVASPANMLAIV
ncbi:hypothetical protein SEUCBS139899_002876 [Sporothrix eucalyptigena]|uniref:Cyclase n=1 Tax=Sporothrix eucalyptigena TaxID=1812306 RepID=A0ABP0BY17_9PEZI